jgi:hypothetical protein
MKNLTDIHNQLSAADQVYLEKRAEQIKIAEEEDAAGRIMARGFADELQKLAGGYNTAETFNTGPKGGSFKPNVGGIIQSKPGYDLGNAGKSGQGYALGGKAGAGAMQKRHSTSMAAAGQAGGSSKNVVGAPPAGGVGRQPKPQVAGGGAGASSGMTAMRQPKPPGMR